MPVRSRPTMRRVDRRRSSLRHPRRPKNARDNHRSGHQPFPSLPSPSSLFAAKNDPVTKNLRSPFPVRRPELPPLDILQFHKDQLLHLSSNVDHRIVVLVSPPRAMTRRSCLVCVRLSASVPKVLRVLLPALEARPESKFLFASSLGFGSEDPPPRSSAQIPSVGPSSFERPSSSIEPKPSAVQGSLSRFQSMARHPVSVPRRALSRSSHPSEVFPRNFRPRVVPVKVLRGARTRVTSTSDSASLVRTRRSSSSRCPRWCQSQVLPRLRSAFGFGPEGPPRPASCPRSSTRIEVPLRFLSRLWIRRPSPSIVGSDSVRRPFLLRASLFKHRTEALCRSR